MPIIPSPKSPIKLLREARGVVQQRTNLTNFEADSKVRSLLDAFEREAVEQRQEKIRAFESLDLTRAGYDTLRRHGEWLGMPPQEATFASATTAERSMAFMVESGTFGGLNGGSDIDVPAGTIISSSPNQNERGSQVQYETTESVTLQAGTQVGFCAVRAISPGASSNVGRGVLRNHNFTNYVQASSGGLRCINFYPILNGRDREDIERYRFRLSRFYIQLTSANNARMQLAAMDVPGVEAVRVLPGFYGIGTAGVIVLGAENQTNQSMVDAVQLRLNAMQGPGVRPVATSATETRFDIHMYLKPNRGLTGQQRRRLESTVRRACLDYFRGVGLGGFVSLVDLKSMIRVRTDSVIRFGRDTDSSFDSVFFSRTPPGAGTLVREELIQDGYYLDPEDFASLGTLEIRYE